MRVRNVKDPGKHDEERDRGLFANLKGVGTRKSKAFMWREVWHENSRMPQESRRVQRGWGTCDLMDPFLSSQAIQILLALIILGVGTIFAFNYISFSHKFPLVFLTGYPFWGALVVSILRSFWQITIKTGLSCLRSWNNESYEYGPQGDQIASPFLAREVTASGHCTTSIPTVRF